MTGSLLFSLLVLYGVGNSLQEPSVQVLCSCLRIHSIYRHFSYHVVIGTLLASPRESLFHLEFLIA